MSYNETPTQLENTMFKLYRKSQTAQYNWILNHPGQWIAINATLAVVFIGYTEYKHRQDDRKFDTAYHQ